MTAARRAKKRSANDAGTRQDRRAPSPAAQRSTTGRRERWREKIRQLYHGSSRRDVRFRYSLLVFDVATITFVIASSFFPDDPATQTLDIVFGTLILIEFSARLFISRSLFSELVHPLSIADIIVILAFLAPVASENFAFLRVVRALRLFRSYQLVARLQRDFRFFKRNQEAIFSVVNLLVFILISTALVYATQVGRNPSIGNYADALYFTVATLTTTGFGDITMNSTSGRLLAVLIMIFGVSLFIRLAQTLFRPNKVHYECPECGLSRHDADSVHCKHCGSVLHIETEGLD